MKSKPWKNSLPFAKPTTLFNLPISPKHQRNGYAFEAVTAILNLLQKDLLLDMVVAGVLPENTPSIKLLEKLGFSREGVRHKALWHEGLDKAVDLVYYYIDR